MEAVYVERRPLVAKILAERTMCEMRLPGVCLGRATTVHEPWTRARSGNTAKAILDPDNCMAACAPCNEHVHDPKFAQYVGVRGLLRHSWEGPKEAS